MLHHTVRHSDSYHCKCWCNFRRHQALICHLVNFLGRKHLLPLTRMKSAYFCVSNKFLSRFRWPRGLRRRSAAAHLMGLRVRIPRGERMSVSCKCCVLSGRGMCIGLIPHPEESYRVCVCVRACVRERERSGTIMTFYSYSE